MDLWAVIFNIWRDEPIYHGVERRWQGLYTHCGRRLGSKTPALPMKHVEKFARPCRSCYPQEG